MVKKTNTPVKSIRENATITARIVGEFKDRQRAEIRKWRQAIELATDINTPHLYALQDLYDNLKDDGHFISQIELRKAATLCSPFSIQDKKTGKVNDEKTKLFKAEWFYNFMKDALESIPYGYTLLELTDSTTLSFDLIPRRNIVPTKDLVLFEATGEQGISYATGYENTLIHIGKKDDLGLMANICGQLIWKRNAQQSWAEFSERFGFPLITATTNKTSKTDIDKIDDMLSALGEAAQAVLPEGTTIDIKPFAGGDAYQVYDKQIERINGEISKPLTGGTMISDNGSSRSQSEVHERNLDDKIAESDKRIITFTVNGQLMRIMQVAGWPINPETDEFVFDPSIKLTLKEFFEIVKYLVNMGYNIPQSWISKTFNIPIEGERTIPERLPAYYMQHKPEEEIPELGGFLANFQ